MKDSFQIDADSDHESIGEDQGQNKHLEHHEMDSSDTDSCSSLQMKLKGKRKLLSLTDIRPCEKLIKPTTRRKVKSTGHSNSEAQVETQSTKQKTRKSGGQLSGKRKKSSEPDDQDEIAEKRRKFNTNDQTLLNFPNAISSKVSENATDNNSKAQKKQIASKRALSRRKSCNPQICNDSTIETCRAGETSSMMCVSNVTDKTNSSILDPSKTKANLDETDNPAMIYLCDTPVFSETLTSIITSNNLTPARKRKSISKSKQTSNTLSNENETDKACVNLDASSSNKTANTNLQVRRSRRSMAVSGLTPLITVEESEEHSKNNGSKNLKEIKEHISDETPPKKTPVRRSRRSMAVSCTTPLIVPEDSDKVNKTRRKSVAVVGGKKVTNVTMENSEKDTASNKQKSPKTIQSISKARKEPMPVKKTNTEQNQQVKKKLKLPLPKEESTVEGSSSSSRDSKKVSECKKWKKVDVAGVFKPHGHKVSLVTTNLHTE